MPRLTGKTALVTGASRGIGRAIARRLAAEGAHVAVHYGTNGAAAQETINAIECHGGRAFAVRAELGTPDDVSTLFEGLSAFSGSLDIVVNNAAVGHSGSLESATPADFDRVFAVNVRAPFFILQRAVPQMNDGGRIINISSSVTRIAVSHELVYGMTKGALDIMSRTLAYTLGRRGITVNSVAAGVTDTDMITMLKAHPEALAGIRASTALGRLGEPTDIAEIVAFLASDDGRWVTGHLIDATGGMSLGLPI
jgi:3-oxoacyl-[acyl-carrier protein] reductase